VPTPQDRADMQAIIDGLARRRAAPTSGAVLLAPLTHEDALWRAIASIQQWSTMLDKVLGTETYRQLILEMERHGFAGLPAVAVLVYQAYHAARRDVTGGEKTAPTPCDVTAA